MAVTASQVDFRFRIWWRGSFGEGRNLLVLQISTRYLNPRMRYYYFGFRKINGCHIGTLFPVSILALCQVILHRQHLCNLIYTHRSYEVTSVSKMAAMALKRYFRCRVCWCHSPNKVEIYLQIKFRSDISVHDWEITTSGFESKRSPYWNYVPSFDVGRIVVSDRWFCVGLPNFIQVRPPIVELWRHVGFQDADCGIAILFPV